MGSPIVRPIWRSRATSLNGDHGEGFRMPFGIRKPPKHEPAGLRQGLWGFGSLPNAIMAASGCRSCRGGCGERDFAPGGRWHRSLPLAMFSPSVKVLAKGAGWRSPEQRALRRVVEVFRAGSRRHPGYCASAGRCARLHPVLERLDDAHAPATAGTRWTPIERLCASTGFAAGDATASSSRARAISSLRTELASKP